MANDINRHSSLKNRDWQIACNEIKNKLQGEKNFFKPQFLVFAQSVVASQSFHRQYSYTAFIKA